MITLYDHQKDALKAIRQTWTEQDRTLCVMATGTGKTIVFLSLLNDLLRDDANARALIIAHRRELIHQPIERAQEFFPGLAKHMGIVMAEDNNVDARVIVATIQTLNSPGRLEAILCNGNITHIVLDEAHHGTAESYQAVLECLPHAKLLGMTATPIRTDGDGLRKVF